MAIPLTSESTLAPAAPIDGDQMLIVELGEGDPEELLALVREAEEIEGDMVAAGRGRKGKRAEYRCAACGYGIVVYGQPPSCPMCSEPRWEHVEWRPFSQLPDFPLGPSFANGRGANPVTFARVNQRTHRPVEAADRRAGRVYAPHRAAVQS